MRHDIARETIADEEDFERYCQRAGGSVGIMLAVLLGAAGPEEDRAKEGMAALGRAMQVTNILRDIDEDLAARRVYISQSAIERFGFPAPGAREELLRDHIARADALYEEGLPAIGLLARGREAMALSAALYREILREIERQGFGREPGRVVVPLERRQCWRTATRQTATSYIKHEPPVGTSGQGTTACHHGHTGNARPRREERGHMKRLKSSGAACEHHPRRHRDAQLTVASRPPAHTRHTRSAAPTAPTWNCSTRTNRCCSRKAKRPACCRAACARS